MGRLSGFSSREVRRVAERLGWEHQRNSGDHRVYSIAGNPDNLSIPDHREIREGTLRDLVDIMGLTVEEFLRLAKK